MKNLYLTILISIFHLNVFSQSKKELKLIVERMKEDSVQIQKEFLLLDSTLNLKIFNLNNQINILKVEKNKMQNILNKQTKELNSLRPPPEEVEVIGEEGIRIDLPNPEQIICCVTPEINVEIEEEGHPINGKSMKDKILIFPKGSGSTVAPYVLLGLFYAGPTLGVLAWSRRILEIIFQLLAASLDILFPELGWCDQDAYEEKVEFLMSEFMKLAAYYGV